MTPKTNEGNSVQDFFNAVSDSINNHARRKNYTDNAADGENKLLSVMVLLRINAPHAIGEIIYKCVEYLKTPRRVLLEKVAGWAYVLWRETPKD